MRFTLNVLAANANIFEHVVAQVAQRIALSTQLPPAMEPLPPGDFACTLLRLLTLRVLMTCD
jgi:hypothetical protein